MTQQREGGGSLAECDRNEDVVLPQICIVFTQSSALLDIWYEAVGEYCCLSVYNVISSVFSC